MMCENNARNICTVLYPTCEIHMKLQLAVTQKFESDVENSIELTFFSLLWNYTMKWKEEWN